MVVPEAARRTSLFRVRDQNRLLSTPRCLCTPGSEKGPCESVTEASRVASCARIARRVGPRGGEYRIEIGDCAD
jgi:hypothetical protein